MILNEFVLVKQRFTINLVDIVTALNIHWSFLALILAMDLNAATLILIQQGSQCDGNAHMPRYSVPEQKYCIIYVLEIILLSQFSSPGHPVRVVRPPVCR